MMEIPKPEKEHQWLLQLVGEWQFEIPGMEPGTKHVGTEVIRSIGELWIQAEGRSRMPDGQPTTSMLTLGFDPQKGKFVGTWLGSMMTYLWVYEGSLDASTNTLTLLTEGPSFTKPGEMAKFKEVVELRTPDHRVFRSFHLDDNGEWHQFVEAEYRRSKS